MEYHYINLDRRADKNEHFLALNHDLLTTLRFSAVDGATLDSGRLMNLGIIDPGLDCYSQGALGCALTHKLLWDYAASQSGPVTIFEDDAVLNRNFLHESSNLLKQLPTDWDIIVWGWNFDSILHIQLPGNMDSVCCFQPLISDEQIKSFRDSSVQSTHAKLLGAFGTVAYSVSPKGAKRLSEMCFPLTKESIRIPGLNRNLLNIGIDVAMNKCYPILSAFAAFPPLVMTKNDKTASDVSKEL